MKKNNLVFLMLILVGLFSLNVFAQKTETTYKDDNSIYIYAVNKPLDEEDLSALVEKLKTALAEVVEDEETQNSITEKWDARMENLVGKTAKQVVDLLLADVKSVIKDAKIVNQLKESFIAAAND